MANYTQLTRIVAPDINEVDYATRMQGVFDTINENFKKIASLPFLQGVQGDSYTLIEKPIWVLSDNTYKISEDGALLLNGIFNLGTSITKDDFLSVVKTKVGNILNEISPLDFFFDNGELVHNTLYFYQTIDDTGEPVEGTQELGQYYYFIDGRLKKVSSIYVGDETGDLSSFNDFTGFYRYVPDVGNERYEKVDMLPTIYYDEDRNDICWKFNNTETGISAIGINGKDGKDSELLYVLCRIPNINSIYTRQINSVYINYNGTYQWISVDEVPQGILRDGPGIVFIQKENTSEDSTSYIAFCEIKKEGDDWIAYWNKYTISTILNDFKTIHDYFYNMGKHGSTGSTIMPRYLAIPDDPNRNGVLKTTAHVLKTEQKQGGGRGGLVFVNSEAWDENGNQKVIGTTGTPSNIYLDNYTLHLTTLDRDSSGNEIWKNSGTIIENGKISIGGTSNDNAKLYIKGKSIIEGDLSINKSGNTGGTLTVSGNTVLNGELQALSSNNYFGPTSSNNNTFNTNLYLSNKNAVIKEEETYNPPTIIGNSVGRGVVTRVLSIYNTAENSIFNHNNYIDLFVDYIGPVNPSGNPHQSTYDGNEVGIRLQQGNSVKCVKIKPDLEVENDITVKNDLYVNNVIYGVNKYLYFSDSDASINDWNKYVPSGPTASVVAAGDFTLGLLYWPKIAHNSWYLNPTEEKYKFAIPTDLYTGNTVLFIGTGGNNSLLLTGNNNGTLNWITLKGNSVYMIFLALTDFTYDGNNFRRIVSAFKIY